MAIVHAVRYDIFKYENGGEIAERPKFEYYDGQPLCFGNDPITHGVGQ